MSQTIILRLLKENPKGLTAHELNDMMNVANCWGQLAKLRRAGDIRKEKRRWILN